MPIPGAVAEPAGRLGGVRTSRVTFIVLLALLGVFMAAGITYAGGRLVSQPIGLAAEPRDLSSSLTAPARPRAAPAAKHATVKHRARHHKVKARTTAPAPTAGAVTPAASASPVVPAAPSTVVAPTAPSTARTAPTRSTPVRTTTDDDRTTTDRSSEGTAPAATAPATTDVHDYDGDDD